MAEIRTRITLTTGPFMDNLAASLERRLTRTALDIEGDVIASISVGQPVKRTKGGFLRGLSPSVEGEPPHVLYGRLRQSITHQVLRQAGRIIARVGTNMRYAARLEKGFMGTDVKGRNVHQGPRPFLRPALEAHLKDIV